MALKGCFFAARVLAEGARTLYEKSEVLAAAKAELQKRMDGRTYECPIPRDVMPRGYGK